ncbi:MAG: RIP metalloprotease RseP [Clostridia bacterium]|nr:RIP metalloprotease RseP [Clostridia bacterium]
MLTAISFIVVFAMLVFFHELGHFAVAKWNGILVHEFSIGMGPQIFSKKKGETLYSLRAFPVGGYVKMEGETEASENPRAFNRQNPLARLSVIFAGPFMNFVLSTVLFVILFMMVGMATTTIDAVQSDSPAMEAGIMAGDKIVSINDETIKTWDQLVTIIGSSDGLLTVEIERDHARQTLQILPKLDEETGRKLIGITPTIEKKITGAIGESVKQVYYLTKGIFDFLADKISGAGQVEGELVGPVGMVKIVGEAAKLGVLNLLMLAAYFSINLGIINLLPLPALDGGRIVFILIELVRGKPIDQEKEGFVHTIGFVLLMLFMVYMIFRDIGM